LFCGTDAAACATCLLAVASRLELAAIAARWAIVRFSAPASESKVLATDVSAGASASSACACSRWKRAACSSGSLLDVLGFCRFCVSRTGFVTMSRIVSFCQKQNVNATTRLAAEISSRRRSSERWSTRVSLSS
jgi:hypothetical protein